MMTVIILIVVMAFWMDHYSTKRDKVLRDGLAAILKELRNEG